MFDYVGRCETMGNRKWRQIRLTELEIEKWMDSFLIQLKKTEKD
jgi:hypothetical protein